jgi:hypothetical protein
MSTLSVFAPARFGRMFAADAKNVSRDPTLIFAILLSAAPALAFHFGQAPMDAGMLDAFGVEAFSRYVAPIAISIPAFLIGWVTGFLFLEDRDEGTLLALDITPVGKRGFIAYRVAVTVLITMLLTVYDVWLVLPGTGPGMTALLAVLVAAEAVAATFILPAVARNKVEGLAITKLTNIAGIVPVLAVIPSPLRYIAGIVPTFWIGELLGLSSERYLPTGVIVVLALVSHFAVAWLLFRFMQRKAG